MTSTALIDSVTVCPGQYVPNVIHLVVVSMLVFCAGDPGSSPSPSVNSELQVSHRQFGSWEKWY